MCESRVVSAKRVAKTVRWLGCGSQSRENAAGQGYCCVQGNMGRGNVSWNLGEMKWELLFSSFKTGFYIYRWVFGDGLFEKCCFNIWNLEGGEYLCKKILGLDVPSFLQNLEAEERPKHVKCLNFVQFPINTLHGAPSELSTDASMSLKCGSVISHCKTVLVHCKLFSPGYSLQCFASGPRDG